MVERLNNHRPLLIVNLGGIGVIFDDHMDRV